MAVGRNVILEQDRVLLEHFHDGADGKNTHLTFIVRKGFFSLLRVWENIFLLRIMYI